MIFEHASAPLGTIRDWLDHRADETPDIVSHHFTDTNDLLTWGELREKAKDLALRLTALGVCKGQSIAICQPNGRNAIITLFGILYGGFRVTPLNLAAGSAALGHAISHSKSSHVFLESSQTHILNAALIETSATPEIITVDTQIHISEKLADKLHSITPNDHALVMYTSGTTGLPKGVVHNQSSLLAGGWTTAIAHGLNSNDVAGCVLPIYHINGLCVTIMGSLISGGQCIVSPRFSTKRFWTDCDTYEVTWFSVVPTIISHLLHSEIDPTNAVRNRIRFGRSASAPLAPETQRGFESRFNIPIVETMGLTETAAQILSNPLPPGLRKIGSPGFAHGNDVSIIDEAGHPIPANVTGEIAIKGPNVMCMYLDNKEATSKTFTSDGWLRTGDLGHLDDDGYVFVTGRLKELIIKGGENIAPREIDEALYAHKDVVEAAAFARDCPTYGQRVEAAVCLRDGSTATSQDLLDICNHKLGSFKSPDCVYILSELPKGASGKIQRMKLEDIVDA